LHFCKFIETKSRLVVAKGRGREEEECLLDGCVVSFGVVKCFRIRDGSCTTRECTKYCQLKPFEVVKF
jgi:hypothetical protein